MPTRSFVIIGNGIAGTGAAEAIRKADPNARVVLIAAEPYPLYNRVALPPYLKLKVTEKKVLMRTAEIHQTRNIELLLNTMAEHIDVRERVVRASNGQEYSYDALLLATGGTPNHMDAPGAEVRGVCYFQTLDDTNEISQICETAKHAVTFGSSFISYELTEAFASRGVPTSWVMRGPRFLHRMLDDEGGAIVKKLAGMHDVRILPGDEPGSIDSRDGHVAAARTKRGECYEADLVGCGLGLSFNTQVCAGTGIKLHRGILTDRYLETNIPNIYAAGDCAEFFDANLLYYGMTGTWEASGLEGRIAAANMLAENREERKPFLHVPSYTSTLFDSRITAFGISPAEEPMLESVMQADYASNYYKRLFFHEHLLVGGVLIGAATKARAPLLTVVKERREIPYDQREALLDLGPPAGAREEEEDDLAV